MLTQRYRPNRFEDLVGQDINVEILRSIVNNPERAPRSLVFHGKYGTGKTSAARIFAKAVNCRGKNKPCLSCDICKQPSDFSACYQEFDSSDVGNVDTIRSMKSDFFLSSSFTTWRTVVFDEFHSASSAAQNALLKVIEDVPKNIFFIFCSTEVENIIDTIRSRSLEMYFSTVANSLIVGDLQRIVCNEGIQVSEDILYRIAVYSGGHVRNAVMALDAFLMVEDKGKYLESLLSFEETVLAAFSYAKMGDRDGFERALNKLCAGILGRVRVDLYEAIKNMLYVFSGGELSDFSCQMYKDVVKSYDRDVLRLFKFFMSDWADNSFESDVVFQGMMWALFYSFRKSEEAEKTASLFDRAKKV